MFDPYMNDVWATRNAALDRFIQAARKVRLCFSLQQGLVSGNLVLFVTEVNPFPAEDFAQVVQSPPPPPHPPTAP